jgi:hypothetical protein
MATPVLFAQFSAVVRTYSAKYRWQLFAVVVLISFAPSLLERAFSFGPTPGRLLFIFMFLFFAAAAPLVAFRRALPEQPWSLGVASWAWLRALLCSAWVLSCFWVIWEGLHGKAVTPRTHTGHSIASPVKDPSAQSKPR